MNVVELLARHVAERPDAPALVEGGGDNRGIVTFAELDDAVARLAGGFRRAGIGPGDPVLVLQPMSVPLYQVLLAVFRLGAVAVVPDPSALTRHIREAVRRVAPVCLVGRAPAHLLRVALPALWGVRLAVRTDGWAPFSRSLGELTRQGGKSGIAPVSDDHPALITFTSGSTGAPKAIVRSHGFLARQHRVISRHTAPRPGSAALVTLPMFVLANLAAGVASVLPPGGAVRPAAIDPLHLHRQIVENGVRQLLVSPVVASRLAAAGPLPPCVEELMTGGGPLYPDLLRDLSTTSRARIIAAYGSSEAEPIAVLDVDTVTDDDWQAMARGDGLLAGRPVPEAAVALLPHGGVGGGDTPPALVDGPGEIVVSGEHVLDSYLDGCGDAAAKLRHGDTVWHRTGDAGRLDDAGRLWLLGRCTSRLTTPHGTFYPFSVEVRARAVLGGRSAAWVPIAGTPALAIETTTAADLAKVEDALSDVPGLRVFGVEYIPVDRRHNSKVDVAALHRMLPRH